MVIDMLPKSMTVRAPAMDEVEAVTELLNACSIEEYGIPEFTIEDLRSTWQSPEFDLANGAWVVISPEGRIAAYADTEHREHARIFAYVRVHPEYCGQGIASHLLRLTEARARQHIPLAQPEARVTVFGFASAVNEKGGELLEQHGFKLVRSFWDMEIDLDEVLPIPKWPEGITLRTFVMGEDEHSVFDAMDEAFQDHWGHTQGSFEEWKTWTVKRESFDPSLWFLAIEGDEIAGMSLCRYRSNENTGWVNTLGVRRPWRRQGLGLALLYHSFGEFYRRGIRKVGLGVDSQNLTGATRLYSRAGMHVARQFNSYEKELRAGVELSTQTITQL